MPPIGARYGTYDAAAFTATKARLGSLAAVWPRGEVQLLPLPNPPGVRVPPPPARQPSGSGPPRLVWTADSRSVVLPPGMHAHASAPLPPPPQLWQPRARRRR